MYPKNNASPERIAIGQVILISDGTIQTSAVVITVRGQSGAEATGGGTTAYGAEGTVYYTPTQAETNHTSFVVIASKASCFSASQTVITTASATAGNVLLSPETHTSAVIPIVSTLTGHTAQTGDNYMGATALAAIIDQFDGTGLTGDTYPSTQSQLSGLANVGSAINRPAASYTLTTGTQSANLYTDTQALDEVRHTHTDAAGVMDLKYAFTIGSGTPSSVQIAGYVTGSNDDLDVFGYDWVAPGWVQIGNIQGSSSTSNAVHSFDLFVNMVGSGVNKGEVEIRFYKASGLSSATLAIDQIFVAYNQGADGYDLGMIWYDDTVSNTNTVVGVDGTSTNPVSTEAAVNTLIASTGLNRVNVAPGSAYVLEASAEKCFMTGYNWTLALAGFSIASSYIENAIVSGIGTGATTPFFKECSIGNVTLPPSAFDRCGYTGTVTVGSAGDFFIIDGFSQVAGASTPMWDMGAVGATNVSIRRFGGGESISNIAAGDVISAEATVGGSLVINGTGGDVEARGMWKQITDSSGGSVAIVDKTITTDNISDGVWDEVLTKAAHNVANSAGKRLRDLASMVIRADTAQGSGTGNNQIQLDTGASSVDGSYDPSIISIVDGTGTGQTRLVLEYDGTSKTATIDRNWKVNPDATSEYVIIGDAGREHTNEGLAQAGTGTTITLNALASAGDDDYNGQVVFIRSGTGEDQARTITDYNGTTKVATVDTWGTNPDTTSAYVVLPLQVFTLQQIIDNTGFATEAKQDLIKAKTDSLTFTNAGEVDANTKSINDAEVIGDGNATPWDGV